MAEWEEKLNTILGDPEAMGQIMALAQNLGLSAPQGEAPPEEGQTPAAPPPPEGQPAALLSAALGGDSDRRTALLTALRPFLKAERRETLDRAIRLGRMARMAGTALRLFQADGEEEDRV